MEDKFPRIYKNKVDKIKSKIQKEFYYKSDNENTQNKDVNLDVNVDKNSLIKKINSIFSRPDYVYQTDVIIMYKNGENKQKKIIGVKDNYIITFEGEKIYIDDIIDIK